MFDMFGRSLECKCVLNNRNKKSVGESIGPESVAMVGSHAVNL